MSADFYPHPEARDLVLQAGGDLFQSDGRIGGAANVLAGGFHHVRNLFHLMGDGGAGSALFVGGFGNFPDPFECPAGAGFDCGQRFRSRTGQRHSLIHLGQRGVHGAHRAAGVVLDSDDHLLDFRGCRGGAFGQFAHFVGHHREAAALLAGAGGFDGGVEGEQVGLGSDFLDHVGDRRDVPDAFFKGADAFGCAGDGFRHLEDGAGCLTDALAAFCRKAHGFLGIGFGFAGAG